MLTNARLQISSIRWSGDQTMKEFPGTTGLILNDTNEASRIYYPPTVAVQFGTGEAGVAQPDGMVTVPAATASPIATPSA